jgi:hypothetical protein
MALKESVQSRIYCLSVVNVRSVCVDVSLKLYSICSEKRRSHWFLEKASTGGWNTLICPHEYSHGQIIVFQLRKTGAHFRISYAEIADDSFAQNAWIAGINIYSGNRLSHLVLGAGSGYTCPGSAGLWAPVYCQGYPKSRRARERRVSTPPATSSKLAEGGNNE